MVDRVLVGDISDTTIVEFHSAYGILGRKSEQLRGENEMAGRLDGKVALITGGASGLGASSARLMVGEGGRVVVADIAEEAGKALAAEIGPSAHFVQPRRH